MGLSHTLCDSCPPPLWDTDWGLTERGGLFPMKRLRVLAALLRELGGWEMKFGSLCPADESGVGLVGGDVLVIVP